MHVCVSKQHGVHTAAVLLAFAWCSIPPQAAHATLISSLATSVQNAARFPGQCMAEQRSALSLSCLRLPAWFVHLQQLSRQTLHSCYRTQKALKVTDKVLAQDPLILSPR